MTRRITLAAILAVAFAFGSAQESQAILTVLDFEFGNTGSTSLNSVNPAYGGFTWDSNVYLYDTGTYNSGYGNTLSAVSGDEFAFNASGVLSILISGGPVNMDSAWFTGWRASNSVVSYTATSVTVKGYLGAGLVGTVNHVTTGSFQQVDLSSLVGVDKIEIVSSNSSQWWLMDDFAYSAVPEPGTMVLLGLGLAGLAATRRRKKN